jgi:hypothetical protein
MAGQQTLPFQTKPHDSLRLGLPALREDALPKHPVEVIQQESKQKVRPQGAYVTKRL